MNDKQPTQPDHTKPTGASNPAAPTEPSRMQRLRRHLATHAPRKVPVQLSFHVPVWLIAAGSIVVILAVCSYLLIDRPLATWVHEHWKGPPGTEPLLRENVVNLLTEVGNALYAIVGGLVAAGVLLAMKRKIMAAQFGLLAAGVAVSGLVVNVFKVIFGRARPGAWWDEGLWGFDPLSIGSDVNGFPSGHSATIGAIAMALCLIWPRAWWACALGALVFAFTRVLTESHYLSDVIVGLFVGGLTVIALRHYVWRSMGWGYDQSIEARLHEEQAGDADDAHHTPPGQMPGLTDQAERPDA